MLPVQTRAIVFESLSKGAVGKSKPYSVVYLAVFDILTSYRKHSAASLVYKPSRGALEDEPALPVTVAFAIYLPFT